LIERSLVFSVFDNEVSSAYNTKVAYREKVAYSS